MKPLTVRQVAKAGYGMELLNPTPIALAVRELCAPGYCATATEKADFRRREPKALPRFVWGEPCQG